MPKRSTIHEKQHETMEYFDPPTRKTNVGYFLVFLQKKEAKVGIHPSQDEREDDTNGARAITDSPMGRRGNAGSAALCSCDAL